ncbi:MAG: rhodanese-like domain-containing protein [Minisyncoccota bacterium]
MKHISTDTFKEVLNAEKENSSIDFINVCTPAEYKEKHIKGVRSVPLDEIEARSNEFKDKKTIYVHCRSGRRGVVAIEKLRALGVTAELVNVEGGLLAWEQAGYDTISLTTRLPLMRQVFLTAGLIVFFASVATLAINPHFAYVALVVGIGLSVSGLTGWCGLALLLAKMPWNK